MAKEMSEKPIIDMQYQDITALNPAPYNPRKKLKPGDPEYEKIKISLNEFGLVDPLVVNKDLTVIGGHQRLTVLGELGVKSVPCSMVDLDKKKEAALNIALNKIQGAWDYIMLKDLLVELDTGEFEIEITGFDSKELENLYSQVRIDEDHSQPKRGVEENECPKCGYKW
jgi:ParB-like chromosome segregation protein Spo0J